MPINVKDLITGRPELIGQSKGHNPKKKGKPHLPSRRGVQHRLSSIDLGVNLTGMRMVNGESSVSELLFEKSMRRDSGCVKLPA